MEAKILLIIIIIIMAMMIIINSKVEIRIMTKLGKRPRPKKAEHQLLPKSKMCGAGWTMPSLFLPSVPIRLITA